MSCSTRFQRSPERLAPEVGLVVLALHVGLMVLLCAASASAATIAVPSGGDLNTALLNARAGDTITLEPGATYVGNFTLPAKDGNDFVTIRTRGTDLVGDGSRVAQSAAGQLAILKSPNSEPAVQTAPGAHHWRLVLLELLGGGAGDLVALGNGSPAQNTLAQVPHDLVIDRCYIHGDATAGRGRCIALNSASTTITGSYISDCKNVGQEAQGIAGWNGPGPFTISNNYVEGSTENILFGGADPSIPNLVPADIVITGNLISKPVAWRGQEWLVKNLVELKNARRVTITSNVIENNWVAGQSGFGVLFTVRNQDGKCRWCQVEQVMFEMNVFRHSAAGISILGTDDANPSQQTNNITIRNNLLADIDSTNWGGSGYAFQILGGPRQIAIDHNTIIQEHAQGIVQIEGPPILQFSYTNNLARHNEYGIIGRDHGIGNDTISAFLPGSRISDNVIADGAASSYPPGNRFPTSDDFRRQFVGYATGDYRLVPNSSWKGSGTDGIDLGANITMPSTTGPMRDPRDGNLIRPLRQQARKP
jgi:hypothetical protein